MRSSLSLFQKQSKSFAEAISTYCATQLASGSYDTEPVAHVYQKIVPCVKAVDPSMIPYVFGSTAVYGLHQQGMDVDLVCLNPTEVQDGRGADETSEVAKGLQSDFLQKLADQFTQTHMMWHVEVVRRTRVPVLRVKGGSEVDFDVTARRRNGVRNSALLAAYFAQQPLMRWVSMLVKQWSKQTGINAAVEGGFLTSYGVNMMVVYYLLRRGVVEFRDPASFDVSTIPPLPRYQPLVMPSEADCAAMASQLTDFLDFYLHEFKADTEVITLSHADWTQATKESLKWTKQAEDMARIRGEKIHYRWCIEDPYEFNLNVGRHATAFKCMLLRKHLERAKETGMLLLLGEEVAKGKK